MKKLIKLGTITAAGLFLLVNSATAQQANDYIQVLRSQAKADKKLIITEAMQFTKQESDAFWPIYREYELERSKINDKRISLIEKYASNFTSMQNETAKSLLSKSMEIDEDYKVLQKKYVMEFEKKISPIIAARFFQVERQLKLITDIAIAKKLPLIPKGKIVG